MSIRRRTILLGSLAGTLAGCSRGSEAVRPDGSRRGATPSSAAVAPAVSMVEIEPLLTDVASAWRDRDRAALTALLDEPAGEHGRAALARFDAWCELPVDHVTWAVGEARIVRPATAVAAAPGEASRVRVDVDVATALTDADVGPRRHVAHVTVVGRGGRWLLAGPIDSSPMQPWDLPGMTIRESARAIVIGNRASAQLDDDLAMADRGVADVDLLWRPEPPRRVVIVAPATTAQFRAVLGAVVPDLTSVAAVTDGVVDARAPAPSDRIVINPVAFGALLPAGRQVVIAHEATHARVRGSTAGTSPMWLAEGFAEFVGYRRSGLPPARIALAAVTARRDGWQPTRLPTPSDFSGGSGLTIETAYAASWLAVDLLATWQGEAAVTRFHRAAMRQSSDEAESTWPRVLGQELGVEAAELVARWRRRLDEISAGSPPT